MINSGNNNTMIIFIYLQYIIKYNNYYLYIGNRMNASAFRDFWSLVMF